MQLDISDKMQFVNCNTGAGTVKFDITFQALQGPYKVYLLEIIERNY